jgi:hypothetical protein
MGDFTQGKDAENAGLLHVLYPPGRRIDSMRKVIFFAFCTIFLDSIRGLWYI